MGLDEGAYERLKAQKRSDESFSDTVKRLTSAIASGWQESFGRYGGREAAELERVVTDARQRTSEGLDERQRRVMDALTDDEPPR